MKYIDADKLIAEIERQKNSETRGGTRPGAGRPRKGEQPRVTISFSVSPDIVRKVRELRNDRVAVNEIVEDYIDSIYNFHFLQEKK